MSLPKPRTLWKHWDTIEKKIRTEINWLENSVDTFLNEEKNAPKGCRECFLRRIAILIVSGQVKATEITKTPPLKSFWLNKKVKRRAISKKRHGSDWHRETMDKIENHFLSLGFKVAREPDVCGGRADLGVFKKGKPILYIEVGTTSFFKLWLNLQRVRNFVYLIIPDDERLIEFVKK
jgi:hypothetical protein